MQILYFILALGTLIFLHELGHYLTAKFFKIEIEEFGFGLPPRLFKLFKFRETEFTVNALPFGAFVRPKGENDPTVPGGLASASPWVRFVVLLGGPFVNLVTGVLLFSLLFSRTGIPAVQISEVVADSPAAQSGLVAKDIVREINGRPVTSSSLLVNQVRKYAGSEISLTIDRNGEEMVIRTTPRLNPPAGQGALGIVMQGFNTPAKSWFETIPVALQVGYDQIDSILSLPGQLIRGSVAPEDARLVGPKGMFDIFSAVVEIDAENAQSDTSARFSGTLNFLAVISIALGFTNLLPIPALDGGRILFLIPEFITRKRVPARFENVVHMIGMVLLLGLMFYITIQDFINPIVLP